MKIALNWISRYLNSVPDAAAAQEALINAGLVVENVDHSHGTDILDVEVTSNRTDCFSHIGLARELAALFKLKFTMPEVTLVESGEPVAGQIVVKNHVPDMCACYSARLIRNVKVGPSPQWLRGALASIGLRSVNNVVDITNFVLMETGQPLHAFDASRIHDQCILIDTAGEEEHITAIDGRQYKLDSSMMVISDITGPLAIAGVMGGRDSEVTQTTKDIILESARFSPLSIRYTARALGLFSDSSFRFERGIDSAMVEYASRRAAALIVEIAGGTLAPGAVVDGTINHAPLTVNLRPQRIGAILGVQPPMTDILDILHRLELSPELQDGVIGCSVPSFRSDISREIDLIEEVARLWGYDKVPVHHVVSHPVAPTDHRADAIRAIRRTLCACGFSETITHSFVDQSEARQFLPAVAAPLQVSDMVRKAENALRPSICPGLLRVRLLNENNGNGPVRLFEYCSVFQQETSTGEAPAEYRRLALVANDMPEVLGAVREVLERLNPAVRLTVCPQDNPDPIPGLTPGAGGRCLITHHKATVDIGIIGVIAPEIVKYYDLRHSVAAAELDLEKLIAIFNPVRRAAALPRFPAVRRDLSVVTVNAVQWAEISSAIQSAELKYLESVEFVGTYRNAQIGSGNKSVTLTLVFRDPESTLRSEQVDQQVKTVLDMLAARFNAVLRA